MRTREKASGFRDQRCPSVITSLPYSSHLVCLFPVIYISVVLVLLGPFASPSHLEQSSFLSLLNHIYYWALVMLPIMHSVQTLQRWGRPCQAPCSFHSCSIGLTIPVLSPWNIIHLRDLPADSCWHSQFNSCHLSGEVLASMPSFLALNLGHWYYLCTCLAPWLKDECSNSSTIPKTWSVLINAWLVTEYRMDEGMSPSCGCIWSWLLPLSPTTMTFQPLSEDHHIYHLCSTYELATLVPI